MKIKPFLPLIVLTLLAGVLRFAFISFAPASPNWDEVSHGYNAYSILMTGKDEWGVNFPLIIRAFGDYKLPLYIYLTVIPVWIFGLNVFAVRFISALAGTLAIPGIYFLVRQLFPGRKLLLGRHSISFNLLSATILTFLPWHFFISRPALEANLSLTLIIYGFYFLLKFYRHCESRTRAEAISDDESKQVSLLPAVILLGLSLHTYNTARVFVPLLVLLSFFIYRPSFRAVILSDRRESKDLTPSLKNVIALLLAFIFSGLVIYQIFAGEGTARYEKLKILSPAVVFQIGEKRAQSDLPPFIARLVYNRPVYFVSAVAKNYFGYFTPDFFSQRWGAQFQFAIPNRNLLTLPVFLFAFVGFFSYLGFIRREKAFSFLYAWLFIAPLAAALTSDPPQALRPNPMIPAIVILACFGLSRLSVIIPEKRKLMLYTGIGVWMLYLFAIYLADYFTDYRKTYSSSWQYGYEQVINFIHDHSTEYDKIFITKRWGEPHIFYAFYTGLQPEKLQPGKDNIRFEKSDWFWTDKIGNVYFVNDWQIPTISVNSLPLESGDTVSTERSLLITSAEHVPINAHVIEIVKFLDGKPAFIITSVP